MTILRLILIFTMLTRSECRKFMCALPYEHGAGVMGAGGPVVHGRPECKMS